MLLNQQLWTGKTCYTSNLSLFEACRWQLLGARVLRVACSMGVLGSRANKTECRIIDCSKQCPFHWRIWLFPSFHVGLQMQTNCFQKHPEALCVTRCVVNTLFFIGASFEYVSIVVMERDWTLSGSLLASCLLQLMEIYIFYFRI